MSLQEFINAHNGQVLDFDGAYGGQCVDLVQFWSANFGYQRFWGNAKDLYGQAGDNYIQIPNSPSAVPQPGDIMVWGTGIGPYGHTSVFVNGDVNSFTSFDQNWPLGSSCHLVNHRNYTGVIGWLRPRALVPAPVPAPQPAPQPQPEPTPIPITVVPPAAPEPPTQTIKPAPAILPNEGEDMKKSVKWIQTVMAKLMASKWASRKLVAALLSAGALVIEHQYNAAAGVMIAYLAAQAHVDSKQQQ